MHSRVSCQASCHNVHSVEEGNYAYGACQPAHNSTEGVDVM